jgi:hypothetical protein
LRLAVYGTSMSDGLWPHLLADQLRERFPRAKLNLTVRAYPGGHLSFQSHCVDTMIPEAADLYIVESVADALNGQAASGGEGGEAEGSTADAELAHLLSRLQARQLPRTSRDFLQHAGSGLPRGRAHAEPGGGGCAPAAPAVMLFSGLDQMDCVRRLKRMVPFKGKPADQLSLDEELRVCLDGERGAAGATAGAGRRTSSMQRVAAATGTPLLSMREALREPLTKAGGKRSVRIISALVKDYLHFTGAGEEMTAELLARALEDAAAGPEPESCPSHGAAAAAAAAAASATTTTTTGEPRASSGSMLARSTCAFGERLNPLVRSHPGWAFTIERNSKGRAKPGWVSELPGARLELCFAQMRHVPPRATLDWNFVFLKSWDRMGTVAAECSGGCTCVRRTWSGASGGTTSVAQVSYGLPVTRTAGGAGGAEGCPCSITLVLLNQTESRGHKFKVIGVLTGFDAGGTTNDAIFRAYSS